MSSFKPGFMLNLLLIVLFILNSLQLSNANAKDEIQFIEQIGENPIKLHSKEIIVLKANCAKRSVTLKNCFIESFWVENWTSPDEYFEWSVESPKAADYVVDVLISGAADAPVEIIGPRNRLTLKLSNTIDHWGNNWDKVRVSGMLSLPKGKSTIKIQSPRPARTPKAMHKGMALESIELINSTAYIDIERRIKKFRSDTQWMADGIYGAMFCWGQWTFSKGAGKKSWPQQVNDFDVIKFAEMVEEMGAAWVMWATTWRTYYFPAPIKAIDKVLPGRTSERDLIGELADELAKRDIRLILYYHCGIGDSLWEAKNVTKPVSPYKENKEKTTPYLQQALAPLFNNMENIIKEVGERYGKKLAGWFFDIGFYPAPHERLGRAAKVGNPERIITWNDWVRPRITEFQDYQTGEGFYCLNDRGGGICPFGPEKNDNGIYKRGPHKGLQAHGSFVLDGPGWGIHKPNQKINPPRFSKVRIEEMMNNAMERKIGLSFNLLIYEDGSISPESFKMMKFINNLVHK